jgi:hypothetical protein
MFPNYYNQVCRSVSGNQRGYKPEWLDNVLPIQPVFKSEGNSSHKNDLSTGIKES